MSECDNISVKIFLKNNLKEKPISMSHTTSNIQSYNVTDDDDDDDNLTNNIT